MDSAFYRSDRADRRVGWLIAVSSLALGVWWVPDALAQWHRFPLWWSLGAWLVAAAVVVMAVFGLRLPMRMLRTLWIGVPALSIALQFVSFGAVRGDPEAVLPWVWLFESVVVCLLALRLRPATAVAAAIVSSLSVPFSAWVFTGGIPYIVLTNTPLRLANVVLVVLVIGIRERLTLLHEAEAEAWATEERRARSGAEAEEQARLSRFVHDEVLSVLAAAQFFDGSPPPELREEAGATIRALATESPPGRNRAGRVDPALLAEQLRARFVRLAPAAEIAIETDDSPVEARPVELLADAAAEALRNTTRHARAQRISVRVMIADGAVEVSVADDGVGFDPSTAPRERLGVRESIVARVEEIGGRAQIVSAPGEGTEVRLSWAP